jgi:hypothetical protein
VVVVALAGFLAGGLRVLNAPGPRSSAGASPGSVFNPGPDGVSLAYRYLEERARARGVPGPTLLAERPRADNLPDGGVLFRFRPGRSPHRRSSSEAGSPERLLTETEEAWVRAGGRLVLGVRTRYGPLEADRMPAGGAARKVFPEWPGVRELALADAAAALSGPPVADAVTLTVLDEAVLASRLSLGEGEVFLLGFPELLENARLAHGDHLRLLEQLAGSGRPVGFDEWTHGLDRADGLLPRLFRWGFGPALVVGAIGFALAVWRNRARLGPPEPDPPESRSEAVDLVDSLAQLYERALSRRDAAQLHQQGFQRAVALRSGLSGAALERRVGELLRAPAGQLPAGEITPAEFAHHLSRINDGYRRLQEHAGAHRRP